MKTLLTYQYMPRTTMIIGENMVLALIGNKFLLCALQIANIQKILKILKKKAEPHTLSISQIINSERHDYLNV